MIYNIFQDKKISALGFGAMRLPVLNGNDGDIDEKSVEKMLGYAMEHGINYYDTAWGYHRGMSEIVMGKILGMYPRESYYLASKFPGYDLSNMNRVEEIFMRQLEKCSTDHFDFYLFHNVCEMNIEQYLDPGYRIFEYLSEQKKNGRIKHLGFSAHGDISVIERFLEKYGEYMEFGQIQLNWIDWKFQKACDKVEIFKKYGVPVWVMEPLRGGRLASLPERYESELRELRSDESPASWAFRFIQTLPVTVTLSGMSDFDQLKQNIATYEKSEPLNKKEFDTLMRFAEEMTSVKIVPCTGCRYCVEYCPQGLDIPKLLAAYNEHSFSDGGFIAPMYLAALPDDKRPSACISCGSCKSVCPQQINIPETLAEFSEKLGI